MTRQQLNVRIAPRTRDEINELKREWGMTEGELVALAIARLYSSADRYMTIARADYRVDDGADGECDVHIYVWGLEDLHPAQAEQFYREKASRQIAYLRDMNIIKGWGSHIRLHLGESPPDWTSDTE